MSMASTMAEALRGHQPLLKEIFGKDEIRAEQLPGRRLSPRLSARR